MAKDKVISFSEKFNNLEATIKDTTEQTTRLVSHINENTEDIAEIKTILEELGIPMEKGAAPLLSINQSVEEFNDVLRDADQRFLPGNITLSATDILVSTVAGIVASVIDIVFVGTPEVVKIYRGGENFDGSILTKVLRSVGSGDDKLSEIFRWCSDKCKVPYDISAVAGVVSPDNHRLRGFAHDPLAGVLFAVADIILGTTTTIDNTGNLRVIINKNDYPDIEKYLVLMYYFGHLISDVGTARGLPIPGFFLTQFFTTGEDKSIARIAEQMYKDGYDLRHMASMSTPVVIKNLIIDLYIKLSETEVADHVKTIAEKEIDNNRKDIYRYSLRLVSDAVCCGGNVLKFFLPPTMGNMTALNLVEWISLLKNTIINLKYQFRDKTVEQVLLNREIINDNWKKLMFE